MFKRSIILNITVQYNQVKYQAACVGEEKQQKHEQEGYSTDLRAGLVENPAKHHPSSYKLQRTCHLQQVSTVYLKRLCITDCVPEAQTGPNTRWQKQDQRSVTLLIWVSYSADCSNTFSAISHDIINRELMVCVPQVGSKQCWVHIDLRLLNWMVLFVL